MTYNQYTDEKHSKYDNNFSHFYFLFEALNVFDVVEIVEAVEKHHAMEDVVKKPTCMRISRHVVIAHND